MTTMRLLIVVGLFCVLLCGCGAVGGAPERAEPDEDSGAPTTAASSPEGGTTVGAAVAEAYIKPVGDPGTRGKAIFKKVGNLGVQVELEVSGLPTKDPDAAYYAQLHEGSCSDERTEDEHEEEHSASAFGPTLALVRFDHPLAKAPGLEAHGGHEPGLPEVPPGSLEQPISFGASADGSASVATLLEGVAPERLASGGPEYIHLHAAGSEDAPEKELACGDVIEASGPGSG
jgi:hypothetical protein